jgi:hypothetical protein
VGPGKFPRFPTASKLGAWPVTRVHVYHLFRRQLPSPPRVESNEHMQVIVQDGKHRALDREHPDQLLEPVLDLLLAMFASLSAQKSAADVPGDAMIPGRNRPIDDGRAWHGHECRLHVVREQENTPSLLLEPEGS